MFNIFSTLKGILFAILFIAIGLLMKKYLTDPIAAEASASKDWPTVEGNVLESKVGSKRSDGSTMYFPEISYSYAVDGQQYTGGKVTAIQGSSSSSKKAKRLVTKYPVGSSATVHYDPETPGIALLEPGLSGIMDRVLIYMPYIFMFAGAMMLFQSFRG